MHVGNEGWPGWSDPAGKLLQVKVLLFWQHKGYQHLFYTVYAVNMKEMCQLCLTGNFITSSIEIQLQIKTDFHIYF